MQLNEFIGYNRQPRLVILANGTPLAGVLSAEVISNNHYSADRFSIQLALNADPESILSRWGSQSSILVDIQASLDGLGFKSLLQGSVDALDLDPLTGVLRLDGRDLTAAFIESRTQESFANRTASEIATLLAQRHNLSAQVVQTTTPVGRYYQNEHDRITLNQFSRATTEWDLLVFLAQQEGFDLFVQGTTLFFQPPAEGAASAQPIASSAFMSLRLRRALTLARDIEVTVKSWNSRQQAAFTQTARSRRYGETNGPPQRYVFVRPNLTPDQALKLAQQKLSELSRHERVISGTMPGELSLTPRSLILLQGTGSDFDQTYYVDQIERTLRNNSGFVQHIRAKNMNPGSQATPPADIVASVTG
ncbi:MAG: phage late control D family protein [Acetobacteraceae bacterium]|nr:phage late control D family protein [Acetobacteraceae bacterium]